jgi:hypothetical protein
LGGSAVVGPKSEEKQKFNQKRTSAAAAKNPSAAAVAASEFFAPEKKNGADQNDSCGDVIQEWIDSLQPDFPKLDVRSTVKDCQNYFRPGGKPEPNKIQIVNWLRRLAYMHAKRGFKYRGPVRLSPHWPVFV